jgi:NAD(P)-dependent dehydrogenase (short-subunit alcohol dehydrogenase family)
LTESRRPKVCVVTGAARGIGAATALAAARRGYAVCINYVAADAEATAVRAAIEQQGGKAIAFRADVSCAADVASLFAAVDRALGPVTALVNNAGISGGRQDIADIDASLAQRVIEINLLGTLLCTKEAVKRMKGSRAGAIVNLSTAAVRTGGTRIATYVAAKAGIEGLTRALAIELAGEGIRVNAVAPGIIATHQQPSDEAWRVQAAAGVPLGRLGTAAEVADAILWLLSDSAAYVTGTVLGVAGGR